MPAKKMIVDWEFGADGLWEIHPPEDPDAAKSVGRSWWSYPSETGEERPRAWSDLLSPELLDALQAWNDWGAKLIGIDGSEPGPELDSFYARAGELADRTQRELGRDYEVFFNSPTGRHRSPVSDV